MPDSISNIACHNSTSTKRLTSNAVLNGDRGFPTKVSFQTLRRNQGSSFYQRWQRLRRARELGIIKLPTYPMRKIFDTPQCSEACQEGTHHPLSSGNFSTWNKFTHPNHDRKRRTFSLRVSEMCASHTYMISIFNLCFSGVSFYLYDCLQNWFSWGKKAQKNKD